MGLAPFIQGRRFGIIAHSHRSRLMDDIAGSMQPIIIMRAIVVPVHHDGAHGMQDLLKGLLHMFGLIDLVVRMAYIELQYGNTIFIDYSVRVDPAKVLFAGNGFSATGHADMRAE